MKSDKIEILNSEDMTRILSIAIEALLLTDDHITTESIYRYAFKRPSSYPNTNDTDDEVNQSRKARRIINNLLSNNYSKDIFNHKKKLERIFIEKKKNEHNQFIINNKDTITSFKKEFKDLLEKYDASICFDFDGECSDMSDYGISINILGYNILKKDYEFSLDQNNILFE